MSDVDYMLALIEEQTNHVCPTPECPQKPEITSERLDRNRLLVRFPDSSYVVEVARIPSGPAQRSVRNDQRA